MNYLEKHERNTMRVRVGCELTYESPQGAHMMATISPRERSRYHKLVASQHRIEPQNITRNYTDGFGNEVWRIDAPAGRLKLYHDAVAEVPPTPDPVLPDLPKTPVSELPDEVMVYTLPSRYCQIEHFISDAWDMFGHVQGGWAQVQAVCDWLHENVTYTPGSTPTTSSFEAYQERIGVCRDFAHLGIVFCRSLNIPARYVSGFLPDIGVPPDPNPNGLSRLVRSLHRRRLAHLRRPPQHPAHRARPDRLRARRDRHRLFDLLRQP